MEGGVPRVIEVLRRPKPLRLCYSPGDRTWPGPLRLERTATGACQGLPQTPAHSSLSVQAAVHPGEPPPHPSRPRPGGGAGRAQCGEEAHCPRASRWQEAAGGRGTGRPPLRGCPGAQPAAADLRADLLLGACHSRPAAHTDFQTLLSVHGAQLASQTGPGEAGASGQPEAPAGGTALAQALGERLLVSSSCRLAEAVRG